MDRNVKSTGYSPTHYLRFAVPPHTTTEPARLQQLWRSIYVGETDEWRDVETIVVQPESTKGNPQMPKGDRFCGTDDDFEHEDWCALYAADPAAGKECDCGLAQRLQTEKD